MERESNGIESYQRTSIKQYELIVSLSTLEDNIFKGLFDVTFEENFFKPSSISTDFFNKSILILVSLL